MDHLSLAVGDFYSLFCSCSCLLVFFSLEKIVSVAGDDDADFAFGVAQVTAGSFRLQYEGETTDCIGCVCCVRVCVCALQIE